MSSLGALISNKYRRCLAICSPPLGLSLLSTATIRFTSNRKQHIGGVVIMRIIHDNLFGVSMSSGSKNRRQSLYVMSVVAENLLNSTSLGCEGAPRCFLFILSSLCQHSAALSTEENCKCYYNWVSFRGKKLNVSEGVFFGKIVSFQMLLLFLPHFPPLPLG